MASVLTHWINTNLEEQISTSHSYFYASHLFFIHEHILYYSNTRILIIIENNLISTMLNNRFPFSSVVLNYQQ